MIAVHYSWNPGFLSETNASTDRGASHGFDQSCYFINVSHKRIFAVLIVHKQTVRPSDDTQRQSLAPVSGAKLTRNYPWTVTITHRGNLPGLFRFPHKKIIYINCV